MSLCLSIFDDIGDYIPTTVPKPPKEKERHRERDDDAKRRHNYFEKPRGEEQQVGCKEKRGGAAECCILTICMCVSVCAGVGGGYR